MALDNVCERFLEEIINGKALSAECQLHVEKCRECQTMRQTVLAFRKESTAYATLEMAERSKKVLAQVMPRIALNHTPWFAQWAEKMVQWQFSIALACVIMLVVLLPSLIPHQNGEGVLLKGEYQIAFADGKVEKRSLGTGFSLTTGKAQLRTSDGSVLDVDGPISLLVRNRGFLMESGRLVASVTHSPDPFIGETPHGTIQVLGTVFMCQVEEKDTKVSVVSGSVRVTPKNGPATVLSAGQSIGMNQPAPGLNHPTGTTTPAITNLNGE